jgi:hypothetical protein
VFAFISGPSVTNTVFFQNPFLNEQPPPEDWLLPKAVVKRSRGDSKSSGDGAFVNDEKAVARQISTQSWHVMAALATAHALRSQPIVDSIQDGNRDKKMSNAAAADPAAAAAAAAASSSSAPLGKKESSTSSPRAPQLLYDGFEYVMLVEDDMQLCPDALSVLLQDLNLAHSMVEVSTATDPSERKSGESDAAFAADGSGGSRGGSDAGDSGGGGSVSGSESAANSYKEPNKEPNKIFGALLVSYGLNGLILQTQHLASSSHKYPQQQQQQQQQRPSLSSSLPGGASALMTTTPSPPRRSGGGAIDFMLANRLPVGCEVKIICISTACFFF